MWIQEVSPGGGAVSTGASGRFRGEISKDGSTITYTLSYSGLEGTVEAHIHFAQRNVAGPIVVFLCRTTQSVTAPTCPQAGSVTGTLTAANLTIVAAGQGINEAGSTAADEFAEFVKAIRAGVSSANVHSTKFPSGEIRGQISAHD